MLARLARCIRSSLLCGEWSAFTRPAKPSDPELFQEIVLPWPSVMVTIVLLNEA